MEESKYAKFFELFEYIPLYDKLPTWGKPLPVVAIGVLLASLVLVALYFLLQTFAPKVTAIVRTTTKESLLSPFFGVFLAIGVFLLLLSPSRPTSARDVLARRPRHRRADSSFPTTRSAKTSRS